MKRTKAKPQVKTQAPSFSKLLTEALELEGKLSDCYSTFHNYSFGNQILAMMQCGSEPINTYFGWQALGRQVKKGSQAIELCMPVTCKKEGKDGEDDETFTRFILRRNWFSLSMTEGKPYALPEKIDFDKARVLSALAVEEIPFKHNDGNVQGYCHDNKLAINPVAKYPLKTLWHELAHLVLGHTEQMADTAVLPRNLREVEAESCAYILSNIFGYEDSKVYSRGYIQSWLDKEELPEASAKRIFKAVSDILKANEV